MAGLTKLDIIKLYLTHLISLFIASLIIEIIETRSFGFLHYGLSQWKLLLFVCIMWSAISTMIVISFRSIKKELKDIKEIDKKINK